jgi:hypothetical protein
MAPMMVNISRYIASLMFVILSFTKDEAEPLEVAIIATIPHATASLKGKPSKTKIGVRMLAPPRPIRDPTRPTAIDSRSKVTMSSMLFSAINN